MKWVGQESQPGEMRHAYNILVGKSKEKRPLGRPRHRWEDNIRMDLKKIGWKGENCIHLVQDRDQWQALVKTVVNFRVL
jgi:hypothetical protein